MRLNRQQRNWLLLGSALFVAALPLFGAFHLHEGDEGSPCWYCVALSVALLPLLAVLTAPQQTVAPYPLEATREPAWFRWVTHHHRGPPISV